MSELDGKAADPAGPCVHEHGLTPLEAPMSNSACQAVPPVVGMPAARAIDTEVGAPTR